MDSTSAEQLDIEDTEKRTPIAKWWRINPKLILLKGHYFFFYGSLAGIIPPIVLYSQQLGMSMSMVGTLFAIIPFIQTVVKAGGGAVADKYQIHKEVLIIGLMVMAASAFSMNFIPENATEASQQTLSQLAQDPTFESNVTRLACDASSKNAKLKLEICQQHATSPIVSKGLSNITINPRWPPLISHCELSCGSALENDTAATLRFLFCSDELLDHNQNFCSQLNHTHNNNESYSVINIQEEHQTKMMVELYEANNKTNAESGDVIGNCVKYEVSRVTLLDSWLANATNVTIQGCPQNQNNPVSLICVAKCMSSSSDTYIVGNTTSSANQQDLITSSTLQVTWLWFGCIITWSMLGLALSLSDAVLVSTLGDEQNEFGKTRLFTSAGWGLISPIAAYLIEYASNGQDVKDYRPGFYMFLALALCNIAIVVPMKVNVGVARPQKLVKEVMATFKKPHVLIFAAAVFFEGVATGVLWTFTVIFADELNDNPVVLGLNFAVECFLSEIPFFWVSGWIVGKLGHATSLACALLITGIKCLLYSFIPDAWYMLPIALIHGVTYGLLYSTLATFANMVAPPGACATLQGIFQGIFEGVGVGVGNFVGGFAYDHFGGRMTFRIFGLWIMGVAAIYQLITYISSRCRSTKYFDLRRHERPKTPMLQQ